MKTGQRFLVFSLVALSCVLPSYCVAVEPPPAVSQALQVAHQWQHGLVSKSTEAVRKELGEPENTKTWNYEGKEYPVWNYRVRSSGTALALYFYNGKMIKCSLLLMSE